LDVIGVAYCNKFHRNETYSLKQDLQSTYFAIASVVSNEFRFIAFLSKTSHVNLSINCQVFGNFSLQVSWPISQTILVSTFGPKNKLKEITQQFAVTYWKKKVVRSWE